MVIPHVPTDQALDRELEMLEFAQRHPERRKLWIWEGSQSLVAPRKLSTLPDFAAAARQSEARGWPVYLRATGGDITPQGPGILNVTHVYTRPPGAALDMSAEYDRLCRPLEAALGDGATRGWQPGAFCDGAYNVQWQGRKFAGTAMRLRASKADKARHAVLAHALMIVEPITPQMVDAINSMLISLKQDRVIEIDAHAQMPKTWNQEKFLRDLMVNFTALMAEPLEFE